MGWGADGATSVVDGSVRSTGARATSRDRSQERKLRRSGCTASGSDGWSTSAGWERPILVDSGPGCVVLGVSASRLGKGCGSRGRFAQTLDRRVGPRLGRRNVVALLFWCRRRQCLGCLALRGHRQRHVYGCRLRCAGLLRPLLFLRRRGVEPWGHARCRLCHALHRGARLRGRLRLRSRWCRHGGTFGVVACAVVGPDAGAGALACSVSTFLGSSRRRTRVTDPGDVATVALRRAVPAVLPVAVRRWASELQRSAGAGVAPQLGWTTATRGPEAHLPALRRGAGVCAPTT